MEKNIHRLPRPNILLLFLVLMTTAPAVLAQNNKGKDSTQRKAPLSNTLMQDPSSIIHKYTYDPILNRYIYTEKVQGVDVAYPLSLTPEEFREKILQEKMVQYFNKKADAASGRMANSKNQKNRLLPIFYINNSFFESIFGGNKIIINPQGSVAVDLGVLYTKQDNPSLSPRNRQNMTFDFNQRISLSLKGKIGKRLTINANYDTESTFNFQNQVKLNYTPTEDDIVQKIEVGNVSMPLNSTLIKGAQSLFGVKTKLQFGKTTITGVFSEQNSERKTVKVQGGGAVRDFEKFILDYDQNRHFFLAHYFRDHYNEALKNYPYISSNIRITRVEVWVTNRANSVDNLTSARNIVAIQDLGESSAENIGVLLDDNGNPVSPPVFSGFVNVQPNSYPDNSNNDFNPFGIEGQGESVLTKAIRNIPTVQQGFGAASTFVSEGRDYAKLQNARQLNSGEYTLHPQLGYITLDQRLSDDEVLGVAFQFTVNGQVYQVGEFANGGIQATQTRQNPNPEGQPVAVSQNLVVKMLKSPITNVKEPIWDLMMKNIYSLDAYQLKQEGFQFNILYSDPQPLNYIQPVDGASVPLPEDVAKTNLLRVFGLDQLNVNQDPIVGGDGFFDYVPGITIDPENGAIIFTKVEPFGKYLFKKLDNTPSSGGEDYSEESTYNANQEKYVFRALYETTKVQASQVGSDKNKFKLTGTYKASGEQGIPIGSFNVPRGSVKVTAGGRELQEGVDYVVNYQLGRVKIINEALKASDTPIQVSTESQSSFGQQTKRFTGLHVQHKYSENLVFGGTYLNLSERPITQKADYGHVPINNSIFGFNVNYSTEVPFFTRLVNKLPNIDTDVESNLSVRGEFAYLKPGAPRGSSFQGEATTYVDDFEASQTSISILSPRSWFLSSVPIGFGGEKPNNSLAVNYKRAELNWYTIDPLFYSNQRPGQINNDDLSKYSTRRVFVDEIFPNRDIVQGQSQAIYTMDLSYYPKERGMYNFNPAATGSGQLPNPEENFGGIMREMTTTNFEQSNVQYIQFWVMDPYIYQTNSSLGPGKITFNLGSISEDVLKDGRKQFENGLPADGGVGRTIETNYARVPSSQSLVYAFETEGQQRENQDVGYDGLDNAAEAQKFSNFSGLEDPAADDYQYYLAGDGDNVVERYKNYNGVDGNSPTDVGQNNRGSTTYPTVEDVNRDNTMNTINSYFEYKVPIYPNMGVQNNTSTVAGIEKDYITDVKEINVSLQNGEQMDVRWVQFKIPLSTSSEYSVGGIANLRSIRFMRMYLSGFEKHFVLRFGTLKLMRGDYRRYTQAIKPNGSNPETTSNTTYEVTSVSQEQSSDYVSPPGVVREEYVQNNQVIREDEQSLLFRVKGLEPNDSRAVYKKFRVDMRQYKTLKMFLHAESLPPPSPELQDDQLTAFIRMGSDFTDNYYQIEIPLKVSQEGTTIKEEVWPESNELKIPFKLLQKVKSRVIGSSTLSSNELNYFTYEMDYVPGDTNPGKKLVGIKGNPSFGEIRVIMLGLKNTGSTEASGEVWFNEFRMSGLKNEGGWAAILNMDSNFADFANISATGRVSTAGFGRISQGPNQRSRENVKKYNLVSSFNLGQMLPDNWGLKIPFSYSRGEELITPKYDPQYLDLELETLLENTESAARREELRTRAENYTLRQSFSLIGLRKTRTGKGKPMPYDISNFTFSGTYNQIDHRDFQIKNSLSQNVNTGLTYNYSFPPLKIEPFKNIAFLDSSEYYDPIQDFNFNPLPSNITASANIIRQYHQQQYRQINLPPGSLGLPTLYQRNYKFNWQYSLNFSLTESLDVVFNSRDNRVVRNYINENNVQDNSVVVWDDYFNVGRPDKHYQDIQINYELPFDKLPILEFIDATYSYSGSFQWSRGSRIRQTLENIPNLGNSIQNSSTHSLNATLNMGQLYNYIGLEKVGGGSQTRSRSRRGGNRLGFSRQGDSNNNQEQDQGGLSFGDRILNTGIDVLTVLERLTVNYEKNQGTYLPGYTNDIGFAGTLKPSPWFTFGGQDNIREKAARNGWLTLYQQFNEQYTETESTTLSFQARLSLLPGLSISLNANRKYSKNYSENYRVNPRSMQYRTLNPAIYGNFNISTILLSSSFSSSDANGSETFREFKDNRLVVARRLARQAGIDLSNPNNINDETGYPKGFGPTSQQVILPSFLAAYSGKSPKDVSLGYLREIPLPNWKIKYTGLMNISWFQENFKRFSLQTGYSSTYNINQFQTNLNYNRSAPYSRTNVDQSGNFRSEELISNINLVEQFSPLIKIDMELKNSVKLLVEVQKDRMLSFSFENNLLTETRGMEYRFGLGYRIKDVKMGTTSLGGQSRVLSSDLNLKADVSFRKNKTIVRYLALNNSETTSGRNIWQIDFTADYALSKNLTAIFYYNQSFSEYAVSTAFPQTTIRAGITLRYNFGN